MCHRRFPSRSRSEPILPGRLIYPAKSVSTPSPRRSEPGSNSSRCQTPGILSRGRWSMPARTRFSAQTSTPLLSPRGWTVGKRTRSPWTLRSHNFLPSSSRSSQPPQSRSNWIRPRREPSWVRPTPTATQSQRQPVNLSFHRPVGSAMTTGLAWHRRCGYSTIRREPPSPPVWGMQPPR